MNTIAQFTDHWKEVCRSEWFKEHQAQLLLGAKPIPCCERDHNHDGNCDRHPNGKIIQTLSIPAIIIGWQNPSSWIYGCRFIIHRRWLTVVGDIGEAVYEWSENLTLEFLSGLDFGYFQSKCRASEKGRTHNDWCESVAWFQLRMRMADCQCEDASRQAKKELAWLQELQQTSIREDYTRIAQEIYDSTGDAESAGHVAKMGEVPAIRSIGHFVGLQMAIAQLRGGEK